MSKFIFLLAFPLAGLFNVFCTDYFLLYFIFYLVTFEWFFEHMPNLLICVLCNEKFVFIACFTPWDLFKSCLLFLSHLYFNECPIVVLLSHIGNFDPAM